MSIPQAQPHAQYLLLFPIVFGINLIHFFDERKDGAARKFDRLFCCFEPLSRHLTVRILRRMRTVPKSGTFLATESVNSAPIKREETKVQIFGKENAKLFANTKVQIFARKSAKLIANFSVTMVTSLPSFSVSLSLSHRAYLTHNIGNASAFPVILMFSFSFVSCGILCLFTEHKDIL